MYKQKKMQKLILVKTIYCDCEVSSANTTSVTKSKYRYNILHTAVLLFLIIHEEKNDELQRIFLL